MLLKCNVKLVENDGGEGWGVIISNNYEGR